MVFVILEKWCKEKKGMFIYQFLDLSRATWFRYKKLNKLPTNICKIICYEFNHCMTFDKKEISLFISEGYYEKEN